ncbi:hypothetical protein RND81_08G188700 [Saponaria officinalis]|uniref:KIB1-4 beta-propeller domain-containing protein n=1 Tax=Saponaria officinalis TaxID=3572 RepID=A0AAW1JAC5_SAPOF
MYTPPNVSEAPWLVVTHENNRKILEKQTFCTMPPYSPKIKSYVKKIVEIDRKFIIASLSGWFVLRERENLTAYSLWNPITLRSIHLPEFLDAPNKWPRCIFTSAPYDNDTSNKNIDCVLLMFFEGLVFFCKPTARDGTSWVKHSLQHGGINARITSVASVNGDIYAIVVSPQYIFAQIKITNDVSHPLIFEPSCLKFPHRSIKFKVLLAFLTKLVDVDAILHFVYIMVRQHDDLSNYDIFMIFVWKLDLLQMEWIRVKSLGESVVVGSWRFHLVLGSYTYLLPHNNFRWIVDGPFWFMPNHKRFSPDQEETATMDNVEDMKEEIDMEMSRTNALSHLPGDILTSIANHMALLDYMNFRVFCKNIDTKYLPPERRDDCSFPLLMSLKNNEGVFELWDPFENISHTVNTPHSPDDLATIEFCKDGWLLLREGSSLRYFNPFTEDSGEYPHSRETDVNASYSFSTRPNSRDCLTVGMFCFTDAILSCFQAANKEWSLHFVEHDPEEDIEFCANYNSSGRYYNGAFYFMGANGNLGVFEMVEEEMRWKVYDGPLTEEARSTFSFLVELNGQLASIFFGQVGKKVQVFTFDIRENSWTEVDDLGKHVLFVSPASSFSVVDTDSTKRNRIYLPFRMRNDIIYYSLNTYKYHVLGKEDSMEDLYGMSIPQVCCWI